MTIDPAANKPMPEDTYGVQDGCRNCIYAFDYRDFAECYYPLTWDEGRKVDGLHVLDTESAGKCNLWRKDVRRA